MKFGKEIQRQQIPGWSPYYLDYKSLKKIISAANKSLAESNSLLIEVLRPSDVLSAPSITSLAVPSIGEKSPVSSPPEIVFAGSVSSGDASVAPVSVPIVGKDEERGPEFQRSKAMFFFKLERELEKINTFYLQKEAELKLRLANLLSKRRLALQLMNTEEEGQNGDAMQSPGWRAVQEGFRLLEKDLGKLQQFIDINATGFRKILKKWDKRSKSKTKELYLARQVDVQPCFNRQLLAQLSDAVAACLIDPVNAGVDASLEGVTLPSVAPSDAILSQQLTAESAALSMRIFRDFEANLSKAIQLNDKNAVIDLLALTESSLPSRAQYGRTHIMRILWRAAMSANSDIADVIISSTPFDLSFVDDINGRTYLHEASIAGDLRLVNVCLTHGTDVNSVDAYGRIALHYACLEGYSKVAEKLLAAGAVPGLLDMDNYSPLIYAVVNGWLDCVRVLVDQPGVTVGSTSLTSPSDLVPLSLAAQYGHVDIAVLLIQHGAVSVANTNGEYPIHFAAREGHADVCRLLVQQRSPSFIGKAHNPTTSHIDIPDKYNEWTPLMHAARNGHVECVQVLLDAGVNPLAADENSRTALHHAAWFGHTECVNKLIDAVGSCSIKHWGTVAKTPIFKSPPGSSSTAFTTMSSGFTTSPYDRSSGPDSVDPGFKLDTDSDQDIDLIPSLLLPPPIMPFRIYGHNYLDGSYLVQVALGHPFTSPTARLPPVQLVPDVARKTDVGLRNSAARAKATSSLKVVMTSRPSESGGGLAASHSIVLPLADESEVFSFQIRHLDDLTLEFSFYPAFGSKVIGRAVASPRTLKDLRLGNARTVPILDHRLHVIGELLFDIYIVKPFKEVALEIGGAIETYWKSTSGSLTDVPTASLGTFGLGSVPRGLSSSPSIRSPAVTAAARNSITLSSLSGELVHLVIQVTRDLVPVVCAEWNVPVVMDDQNGPLVDIGVADVSADQFQRLAARKGNVSDASMQNVQPASASEWQRYLSGSLYTLADVFRMLPVKYGVSLELRYPNPVIRERYRLGRNHEPNEFVDSVLRTVYSALAASSGASPRRKIVFSSFVPAICTAINWKQPNYAVFFASKGGVSRSVGNGTGALLTDEEENDNRCRSVSAAVQFARSNNLLGVILNALILQQVPSLIPGIKEHGVMLAAFGSNSPLLSTTSGMSMNLLKIDATLVDGVLTFADQVLGTV